MKKGILKKAVAMTLSAAMACSMPAAATPATVSAAANKYVSLNTTFKTLKVGQKDYRLRLKNNTVGWKIKKVTTTDKKIAMVYGKTASYVLLKGKAEGRATVRVNVTTSKRKKNNKKTLRCRVNVVAAPGTSEDPTKPVTPPAITTEATVGTQAELDSALANKNLTKITVSTTAADKLTIPSGSYQTVDLTVNAPNADIENRGQFKSITIQAIKENTWWEYVTGNRLHMRAKKGRIVLEAGSSLANVTLQEAGADVTIELKGNATIGNISITTKMNLILTGSSTAAASIPVSIENGAKDATITTSIKLAVSTAVQAALTFLAGAEDSTVSITQTQTTVTVNNQTKKTVPVMRPNGTSQNVAAGSNAPVYSGNTQSSGTNTNIGGGSTGNTSRVSSVTVSPSGLTLTAKGKPYQFEAIITPSSAANEKVTWKSRGDAVTVNETGLVTPVAEGTARILATADGVTGWVDVTVTAASEPEKPGTKPDDPGTTPDDPGTTDEKKDISKATVTMENQTYTYNGKDQEPAFKVELDGKELVKGTDYTVKLPEDIKNAGEKTFTIEGAGDYAGSSIAKSYSYTIEQADISKATVTWPQTNLEDDTVLSYTGEPITPPVPESISMETALLKDTDYTISNNPTDGISTVGSELTVTITGQGNYSGTVTKTFHVQYTGESISVKALDYASITNFATTGIIQFGNNPTSGTSKWEVPTTNAHKCNIDKIA